MRVRDVIRSTRLSIVAIGLCVGLAGLSACADRETDGDTSGPDAVSAASDSVNVL